MGRGKLQRVVSPPQGKLMSIPTDHLFGAFDTFETSIVQDPSTGEWVASALGLESRHRTQDQALNDLNEKVYDAVSRGELVPNMGN
jgi:hypothetical protein